jgi:hypothetical protein
MKILNQITANCGPSGHEVVKKAFPSTNRRTDRHHEEKTRMEWLLTDDDNQSIENVCSSHFQSPNIRQGQNKADTVTVFITDVDVFRKLEKRRSNKQRRLAIWAI